MIKSNDIDHKIGLHMVKSNNKDHKSGLQMIKSNNYTDQKKHPQPGLFISLMETDMAH